MPVLERVDRERFRLATSAIERHSDEHVARLIPLYQLGSRYHAAHGGLRAAHARAYQAVLSMGRAVNTRDWRDAAITALAATTAIEDVVVSLAALPGMSNLAQLARAVVSTATQATQANNLDELDNVLAALSHLRAQRRAVRSGDWPAQAPEDLLIGDEMDDDGATGYEQIEAWSPWRDVAWRAWRTAGQDMPWPAAWDAWRALDRFELRTIGAARSASARAVENSRARARYRPPK
ncbi:MAG: hypothetical protein M3619_29665 [Myxococcota bacterium]|nr:hypothetical protein [Myxococcota bacterium]